MTTTIPTPLYYTVAETGSKLIFIDGELNFAPGNVFYSPDAGNDAYGVQILMTYLDEQDRLCAYLTISDPETYILAKVLDDQNIRLNENRTANNPRREQIELVQHPAVLRYEPHFVLKNDSTGQVAYLSCTTYWVASTYHVYVGTGNIRGVMQLTRVDHGGTLRVVQGGAQSPLIVEATTPQGVIDIAPGRNGVGRGDWHQVAAPYTYVEDGKTATVTAKRG